MSESPRNAGHARSQSTDTELFHEICCWLFQVAKEFGFQNNGFSVYINRNKTGEITASSNKSLNLLKIKWVPL